MRAGWRAWVTLRPRQHAIAGAALLILAGCRGPRNELPDSGESFEFGVFYGGQIQERDEIPLELDSSRQRQGFRLALSPPPASPLEVRWELGRPGVGPRAADSLGRKARPRKIQLGRAYFRPGEGILEQPIQFSAGDPLGLWNIRVQLGERVVIDRPFLVFDPVERARREQALVRTDAGL